MNQNDELLDSGIQPQEPKSKQHYQNRALIYIVCMLGCGLLYTTFLVEPKFHIFLDALLYTGSALVTALPIEAVRKVMRDKKRAKMDNPEPDDPFWFHVIESALSLLIIILVLGFIANQ